MKALYTQEVRTPIPSSVEISSAGDSVAWHFGDGSITWLAGLMLEPACGAQEGARRFTRHTGTTPDTMFTLAPSTPSQRSRFFDASALSTRPNTASAWGSQKVISMSR
jgi:hypothetical protein